MKLSLLLFTLIALCRISVLPAADARPNFLIIVADDTLVPLPAAGVLQGLTAQTALLFNSHASEITWRRRVNLANPVVILPASVAVEDRAEFDVRLELQCRRRLHR